MSEITNDPNTPFVDAGLSHYRAPTLNDSGEWVLDYTVPCEDYNLDVVTIDAAWRCASFTAFLSVVLGGGGAMYVFLSSCIVFRRSAWRWAGYELLAAVLCQVLTFSWFATSICHENDNACALNYGARADILAAGMWASAAACLFRHHPSARKTSPPASNSASAPQPPAVVEMADRAGEVEIPSQSRAQTGESTMDEPGLDEHEII